jgi:glycosyltransferase involved in cell wall biosynthesis
MTAPCRSHATAAMAGSPLRVAIIGTRGVPARYGGFETLAAHLSERLAARGHLVDVYCRRGRVDSGALPQGVRQRFVPMLPTKYFETISHTALSVLAAIPRRYDAILMVNAANAIFSGLPRLFGTPVTLNVDGIERKRAKWGRAGKAWYLVGERLATVLPNSIISDAIVIEKYYRDRYHASSTMIPYGSTILNRQPAPDLTPYGLQAGRYLLYVSRLEPENNAALVIEAYRDVPGELPLAIVGDAPYATSYKAQVAELAARDPRVRLMGSIYGSGYQDLQRAALAYIQATEVGGTHPALIEAMGAGNLVLAMGTPENVEVTAGTALLFNDQATLAAAMTRVADWGGTDGPLSAMADAARGRALAVYSWDAVADAYEALFTRMAERRGRSRKTGQR